MICRLYGWTWQEFLDTPHGVIEILSEQLAREAREREAKG